MCGRINLRATPFELKEFFELFREPTWDRPRFNLGPMQRILIVRQNLVGERLAEPVQWGLVPSWAKNLAGAANMINARSDTIATKPAYRSAFKSRRCLIPASGFYEWQVLNSKTKQAWHIFRKDGQPLAFAGLWEHWESPDSDALESCSIITTDANPFTAEFHDRMPIILDKADWPKWLDPDNADTQQLRELLIPCPFDWLDRTAVGPFVGKVSNDSPECIRPIPPERLLF